LNKFKLLSQEIEIKIFKNYNNLDLTMLKKLILISTLTLLATAYDFNYFLPEPEIGCECDAADNGFCNLKEELKTTFNCR
jgi:hypothetical protein